MSQFGVPVSPLAGGRLVIALHPFADQVIMVKKGVG